jgi:hypothetical protein
LKCSTRPKHIPDRLRRAQAHKPTGPVGHVEGWIFAHRSSNVRRNRWAVELLEVKPRDRVSNDAPFGDTPSRIRTGDLLRERPTYIAQHG